MTILNNIHRLKDTRKVLRNNATKSEVLLWENLRASKLMGLKFRRQHSIGRYILDFYNAKMKIGIELDGEVHSGREEYDSIRTEYLNIHGIKVIRFTNEEVLFNLKYCLESLEKFINNNYDK